MVIIKKIKRKQVLLILFVPLLGFSQNFSENIRFPLWTFHSTNTTCFGISVGAYSKVGSERFVRTNGIRLEVPGIGFLAPIGNGSPISYEVHDALWEDVDTSLKIKEGSLIIREIVNGINISSGSWGELKYNGITLALIAQNGNMQNGIAVAGVWNSITKSNGISICLLLNESFYANGIQVAITNHIVSFNGISIGLFNKTNLLNGVEIGLFNRSKRTRGIQIGLWNKNEKRQLPFINWNFKD